MTKEEFSAAIQRLGLKIDDVAKLLGMSLRSVYRYQDGTRPAPPVVAAYLRLYEASGPALRASEHRRVGI